MNEPDYALWNVTRKRTLAATSLDHARAMTRDEDHVSPNDEWVIWQMPPGGTMGSAVISGWGPDPVRPTDRAWSMAEGGPCG